MSARQRIPKPILKPTADWVLDRVRLGHTATLNLTPQQRATLRNPKGIEHLWILRHFLAARTDGWLRYDFPLTEGFIQRLSRRLGRPFGGKKARAVTQGLAAAGVIARDGGYMREKDGSFVPTWRVTGTVWVGSDNVTALLRPSRPGRSLRSKSSVGSQGLVKRSPWWKHPEMGTHDGRPPPGTSTAREEHWRKEKHWRHEAHREERGWVGSRGFA